MSTDPKAQPAKTNRGTKIALVVAAITLIAAAAPLVVLYDGQSNSLLNNNRWLVFKRKLAHDMMGADAYLTGAQALAGNRLNLGAWHGYQEVLLREKVRPKRIAFDFYLEEYAYVVAEFDRGYTDPYYGFRLSANERVPHAALHVDVEGKFLSKDAIDQPLIKPNTWHAAAIHFGNGEAVLRVDGDEWMRIPYKSEGAAWAGFRGGAAQASVDNVVIEDRSRGLVIRERFDNRWEIARGLWRPLLLGLLLACAAGLVLRLFHKNWRDTLWTLTAIHISVAAATITYAGYRFLVSSRHYPGNTESVQRLEASWVQKKFDAIQDELDGLHQPDAAPGSLRLLFVGTSQTRGVGANETEETFVARIGKALNEPEADLPPVECINTAIPGGISRHLINYYTDVWIDYAPDLVVINLAVNDDVHEDLGENLRAFAAHNRERGIATLFVLEALSSEKHTVELRTHEWMRETGEELGIPVLESNAHLTSHYDDGFLWWDIVHPSSYGHGLIADFLLPPITEALQEAAAAKQVPDPAHAIAN